MSTQTATELQPTDEDERNAYNSVFSEMDIDWHWDRDTYRQLLAEGEQPVRTFVKRHRPHLLRAYGMDCLVNAIESMRRDVRRSTSR